MPTFFPGDLVRSRQYGSGQVKSIDSDELDAFGKRLPVSVEFENGAVRNFTERGQLQHGTFDWQFMISPLAPQRKDPPSPLDVVVERSERIAVAVESIRGFLRAKPNDVIALSEDVDGRTHCLRYRDLEMVVAAARMHLQEVWEPIETAPKDGTWVLLSGGKTTEYDYSNGHVRFDRPVTAFWSEENGWAFCYWDGMWREAYKDPTHWCRLP